MKKQMSQKLRLLCLFGSITFVAILAFVVIVDPFYHYHKPFLGMQTYLYNAVYQTAGVARNFEYDSAIVGTSMTENFQTDWFKEELGMNTVKLSYSGARTSDIDAILEQMFQSGNEIKTVYMDLNGYQLEVPSQTAYVERPKYLYDSNLFNDLEYICNMDTLATAAGYVVAALQGREDNMNVAYTWDEPEAFGKDKVMEAAYAIRLEYQGLELSEQDTEQGMLNCRQNLENMGKHIMAHPETTFVIMYPPYSIMYWDDVNPVKRELLFDMFEMSLGYFGDMSNVEMYFYMDDYEVITDLSLYRDLGHYTKEINCRMFRDFTEGKFKVTKEQGIERLYELKAYVNNYDFAGIWKEYEER